MSEREPNVEEISAIVVDTAFHIHKELGPGLLESVYEAVLARALMRHGLTVERHKTVTFEYDGMWFEEGLRVDLLVNQKFVIELKSVETLAAVHPKQILTYLRLLKLPLGLLINFGAATFKEGVRRIVNNHNQLDASRLRLNQPDKGSTAEPPPASAQPETPDETAKPQDEEPDDQQ